MTVDFCYKLMQYIVNKNQQGYLSPDQFDIVINQAQTSYLNYLLGDLQQFQNGRPVSKVSYGLTEVTRQQLEPLISKTTLTIDGTGYVLYPSGYQYTDTLMMSDGINRIRYVPRNKLYSYLKSQIDPVLTNPIYTIDKLGYTFYPASLGSAILYYVGMPPVITWAYTLDGNGRPIYNPSTSADPVWLDTSMLDIIARALRLVGVNLQSQNIDLYANEIKQGGQ